MLKEDEKFIKHGVSKTGGWFYKLDLQRASVRAKTLHKVSFVIVEQNTSYVRELLSNVGFQLSTLRSSGYLLAINDTLEKAKF